MTLKLSPNPLETRVTTRDGREARILAYYPEQDFCFIGVRFEGGERRATSWRHHGKWDVGDRESINDLINAPEPEVVLYVGIYRTPAGRWYCGCAYHLKEEVGTADGNYQFTHEIRFRPAKGEK